MEHSTMDSEITFHHEPSDSTKRIWKTFWILLIITIIELSLGLVTYATPELPVWVHMFMKGVIIILSLAKAFYIVSIFMHLGDEIRNMIMTIVLPLLLFVWFIGAFLWDGNSFRTLRNRYNMEEYHPSPARGGELQHAVPSADTTTHRLD